MRLWRMSDRFIPFLPFLRHIFVTRWDRRNGKNNSTKNYFLWDKNYATWDFIIQQKEKHRKSQPYDMITVTWQMTVLCKNEGTSSLIIIILLLSDVYGSLSRVVYTSASTCHDKNRLIHSPVSTPDARKENAKEIH